MSRTPLVSNLKNELELSRAKIKQLQKDNAWLLRQCARLTSLEQEAGESSSALLCQLKEKEEDLDDTKEVLARCVSDLAQLQHKYHSMKKKSRHLKKECKKEVDRVTQFFDDVLDLRE
ncbi:hypothetical protein H0H92_006902 [Tricholoma furcatifolium]|nr:hypothetical protein H0H92_006902 [Tricholoma furcatifolium]